MTQTQMRENNKVAARAVKEVYPVSRLVREARSVLEGSFPLIWVEGEISNLAMPASGHIYFTLKDEAAQVRCAMFRMRNRALRFTPENGMQVLIRVRVTLYEGRGEFQLVVEHMEEAGEGALQRAFEALKHRLGQAGLFDQAHKKTVPILPKCIGVVSSPDGAAVHDILTVLKRRFPTVPVILYPVAVQGAGSAKQIAQAIVLADERQECDVLIIGRGGGSLEDLWSFNEEVVAQAIFDCEIPIISAVGHEVDFTIADFVADIRAATPSAAAELAAPDGDAWLGKLQSHCQQLGQLLVHRLQQNQQALDHTASRLRHPQAQITIQNQHVENLGVRLTRSMQQQLAIHRNHLILFNKGLQANTPDAVIANNQTVLSHQQQRLESAIIQKIQRAKAILAQQMRTLGVVSPLNTLERGYSITTRSDGTVVQDAQYLSEGEKIIVTLQRGRLKCNVSSIIDLKMDKE